MKQKEQLERDGADNPTAQSSAHRPALEVDFDDPELASEEETPSANPCNTCKTATATALPSDCPRTGSVSAVDRNQNAATDPNRTSTEHEQAAESAVPQSSHVAPTGPTGSTPLPIRAGRRGHVLQVGHAGHAGRTCPCCGQLMLADSADRFADRLPAAQVSTDRRSQFAAGLTDPTRVRCPSCAAGSDRCFAFSV